MPTYLDFEKPIAELEGKIEELRHLPNAGDLNIAEEVARLQQQGRPAAAADLRQAQPLAEDAGRAPSRAAAFHATMSPAWSRTSRRWPATALFAEDRAIMGGLGRFRGRSVLVLGHEKGTATESRVRHNFGMARPEGYRKAQRLMELADRFGLPVLAFVDTPGAYPGVERRGARPGRGHRPLHRGLPRSSACRCVAAIIGEGGSGGAIALAAANRVLMLEHAVYSVISPEGCASILWRNRDEGEGSGGRGVEADGAGSARSWRHRQVVPEPLGGAHRGKADAINAFGDALERALASLTGGNVRDYRADRRNKFLSMGRKGLA